MLGLFAVLSVLGLPDSASARAYYNAGILVSESQAPAQNSFQTAGRSGQLEPICQYRTCKLADVNGDGLIDIVSFDVRSGRRRRRRRRQGRPARVRPHQPARRNRCSRRMGSSLHRRAELHRWNQVGQRLLPQSIPLSISGRRRQRRRRQRRGLHSGDRAELLTNLHSRTSTRPSSLCGSSSDRPRAHDMSTSSFIAHQNVAISTHNGCALACACEVGIASSAVSSPRDYGRATSRDTAARLHGAAARPLLLAGQAPRCRSTP
ncbi:MAG: hypothetical protein JWN04_1639 [Myxococcaceae bacterium]|nr:hypothetical protein [Myxococcaceae bacterium]